MRTHVGYHILNNDVVKSQDICGFCGIVGCKIELSKTSGFGTRKTLGPTSNCSHFYGFSLKAAAKISERSPCTNRPVRCDLCEQIYWSYNIEHHYEIMHANPSVSTSQIANLKLSEDEKSKVLKKQF
jgi:hypothetical protein